MRPGAEPKLLRMLAQFQADPTLDVHDLTKRRL